MTTKTQDMTMNELSSNASHIATQQEKLDALFGITDGKDINDFLDGLSLDNAQQMKENTLSSIEELSAIEQNMQSAMNDIAAMPINMSLPLNELSVQMSSLDCSLRSLEELIDLSKDIIKHVHASILATPLIDSEAVQAYGKLVESIHISINEFINIYRDKQNFVNKIKYALFDKEIKKELMDHKAKLQKEIMLAKEGPKSIEADSIETNTQWNIEKITKILDQHH